jgi:hypothetical protein
MYEVSGTESQSSEGEKMKAKAAITGCMVLLTR